MLLMAKILFLYYQLEFQPKINNNTCKTNSKKICTENKRKKKKTQKQTDAISAFSLNKLNARVGRSDPTKPSPQHTLRPRLSWSQNEWMVTLLLESESSSSRYSSIQRTATTMVITICVLA